MWIKLLIGATCDCAGLIIRLRTFSSGCNECAIRIGSLRTSSLNMKTKRLGHGLREISSSWQLLAKQACKTKRGVRHASRLGKLVANKLKVSATFRVSAIAI